MNLKVILVTAIFCTLLILLFTSVAKLIVGGLIVLGIASMIDWYGDGDGREFPGRWRKE